MKKTIVIFSGAGLSVESGIPTFRDSNGLWENHKVEDVATYDGWIKNTSLVLDFYAARFANIASCVPNDAHKAIASLESFYNVINITQNIDDLLERAGCTNVIHLHGKYNRKKCSVHELCDYNIDISSPIVMGDLCPKCGNQTRPDVVWFGEDVPAMDYKWMKKMNKDMGINDGIFICIGTSGRVYPTADILHSFYSVKRKYIIDKNPSNLLGFTKMTGNATEQMKILADILISKV